MEGALRFVILCNSMEFEAWQIASLKAVMESEAGIAVGVVLRAADPAGGPSQKWRKRWRDRKVLTWRLFEKLFVRPFSLAIKTTNAGALLKGVPVWSDRPSKVGRYAERLHDDTLDFIRNLQPDFIVRFGYGILDGDVLDAAPFGLWSYHHGDPSRFRGQPPGFWEILTGAETAGAVLQVLSSQLDAGRILHRGSFAVFQQSYAKTRDTLYFGSASFIARACRDVLVNGWNHDAAIEQETLGPIYKQPDALSVLKFAYINLRTRLSSFFRYRISRQTWNCAIISAPIHEVAGLAGSKAQEAALRSAVWMDPGPQEFFADPFGYRAPGSPIQILFERFNWRTSLGTIASVSFDGEKYSSVSTILDTGSHLSYPYILSQENDWFVIPENSAEKRVVSYRLSGQAVADHEAEIFTGKEMVDTSFVDFGGRKWAFCTIDDFARNTHLHVFYFEDAERRWAPHPLNPVKSDIRSARPAGTPFVHAGILYRPGQDCSRVYGGAVIVNEVQVLTDKDYQEVEVSAVRPPRNSYYHEGVHTISGLDEYTLIDGATRKCKFV